MTGTFVNRLAETPGAPFSADCGVVSVQPAHGWIMFRCEGCDIAAFADSRAQFVCWPCGLPMFSVEDGSPA